MRRREFLMGFSLVGGLGCFSAGGSVEYDSPEEIAQILTAGEQLTHVFTLTDSLLSGKQSELLTGAREIRWGGVEAVSVSTMPANTSVVTTGQFPSGDAPFTVPGHGYLSHLSPGGATLSIFNGGAVPNGGPSALPPRIVEASVTEAAEPLLWSRLETAGEAVRARWVVANLPGGNAQSVARLSLWSDGGTNFNSPGAYQGEYFSAMGAGWRIPEVTIPEDFDWSSTNYRVIDLAGMPGAATENGEELFVVNTPWLEMETGAVLHMWGVGGRSVDGYLNSDIFDPALLSSLLPQYGEHRIFWLELGTNNPAANTAQQHVQKMRELIRRCRVGSPGCPVIITTGHATVASGSDPYFRQAARDLAALPGVLVVDTFGALPSYAVGSAAGLYADTIHYHALASVLKAAAIGDMVQAEASTTDAPAQFGPLLWGFDSTRVTDVGGVPTELLGDTSGTFTGPLYTSGGALSYATWSSGQTGIRMQAGEAVRPFNLAFNAGAIEDYSIALVFRMEAVGVRYLLSDQLGSDTTARLANVNVQEDGSIAVSVKTTTGGPAWASATAPGVIQAGGTYVVQVQRIRSQVMLWLNGQLLIAGDVGLAAATAGGRYGTAIGGYSVDGSYAAGEIIFRAGWMWPSAVNPLAIYRWAQRRFAL